MAQDMDLSHPWSMFSALIIGLIGMAVFLYGKKETDLKCLGIGAALCIFPYFVTSILAMWAITAACLGALWAGQRATV